MLKRQAKIMDLGFAKSMGLKVICQGSKKRFVANVFSQGMQY